MFFTILVIVFWSIGTLNCLGFTGLISNSELMFAFFGG